MILVPFKGDYCEIFSSTCNYYSGSYYSHGLWDLEVSGNKDSNNQLTHNDQHIVWHSIVLEIWTNKYNGINKKYFIYTPKNLKRLIMKWRDGVCLKVNTHSFRSDLQNYKLKYHKSVSFFFNFFSFLMCLFTNLLVQEVLPSKFFQKQNL